ncbi:melanoma antigen preferentially expressed in tumors-like [Elephas maximus indicus]|uniref:melanoma antigen preferentially expressed in tumors-like n=1 Tax=Elephas maximus indicus TaxID=99487 RepID=UPI0021165289|nr:melanoma antigen preferentially expressed in tumors-like [Elephas maximus indicus]
MSRQDPRSLLDLAVQSLLSDEDSAVRVLKELPVSLFPILFTKALAGGHRKIVKAMVQLWRFPCLHVGSMRKRSKYLLEAVLDGLQLVPANTACHRRSKLKVLDVTHDYEISNWEECSETSTAPFLITHRLEKLEADQHTLNSREQSLCDGEPVEINPDLKLCGLTLVITQVPFCSLVEIMGTLELESTEELRLQHKYMISFQSHLLQFFTQVGQITSLSNLILPDLPWNFLADCFSVLSCLGHLKKLHLIFSSLSGQLRKMLSCLQKLLESLVVTGCRLIKNDIAYLSLSIHATCLKELVLSNNNLSQMAPGPLEVLLGKVSDTLQHLNLRSCELEEFQLKALLPALCSCSHLWSLVLGDNLISMSGLMNVLQQLAGLKELKCVQYPVPAECVMYLDDSRSGKLNRVKVAQVHTILQDTLQTLQREDIKLTNPWRCD